MRSFVNRALIACLALVVSVAACASPDPAASDMGGDLVVFAAASLTDAFEALGNGFTAQHPEVNIVFNFAGSQLLAAQIVNGAPADVFASANEAQMESIAAEIIDGPRRFTTNALAIVVAPGNPRGLTGLVDLADPNLLVVLADEGVPVGRYARNVLDRAGVDVHPVSLESSVRSVLSKVVLGEADAGIVYQTDIVAAGADAEGVSIPAGSNVVAGYFIASTGTGSNPIAARAFLDYVAGDEARSILTEFGFGAR